MMKVYLNLMLLASLILFCEKLHSQENFLPAHIVHLNTDTVNGYIDYRNWSTNPGRIAFKTETESKAIYYSPTEIKEFYVANEEYVGAVVKVDPVLYGLNRIDFLYKNKSRIDTVFLRTLVKGEKSLFSYKDKNSKDHFFIKENGEFVLLQHRIYYNENKDVVYDNKYRGQLLLYFEGDLRVKSELENTKYERRNLEKVFEKYYGKDHEAIKSKKNDRVKLEFSFLAGLSVTQLNYSGDVRRELLESDFENSNTLTGGISLDFILPRTMGKWSVNNDILYNHFSSDGKSRTRDVYFRTYDNYMNVEYSYLRINNFLRFRQAVGNFYFYGNIGISHNIILNKNNYLVAENNNPYYNFEEKLYKDDNKYEQGFVFGIGSKFKSFSLEIRYITLNSASKQYCILFGYDFTSMKKMKKD